EIEMQSVDVPEPEQEPGSVPEGFEIIEEGAEPATAPAVAERDPAPREPVAPIEPAAAPAAQPQSPTAETRLDSNNLPVSWAVQLASLSNRASAESLQQTLRSQGY